MAETTNRGLIVFEATTDGHVTEWINHLIRFAITDLAAERVAFIVSTTIRERLEQLVPPDARHRITMEALSAREQYFATHSSLTLRAFAQWWLMRRFMKDLGARAGHFLAIDHLCLPLALGLGFAGRPVSGILFRASLHEPMSHQERQGLGHKIRSLVKATLYRASLANPAVKSFLALDPLFAPYARSYYRFGDKVGALLDPVPPEAARRARSPQPYRGDTLDGRTEFLMFGAITERKGVLKLLDALAYLEPQAAARTRVVIAGTIAGALRQRVSDTCADLKRQQPDLEIKVVDGFQTAEDIASLVQRCDVVLAPYQNFIGSSGVLLWAAQIGKPVLSQDQGYMGRVVREARLGLTVKSENPIALAAALSRMLQDPSLFQLNLQARRHFLRGRSPRAFASAIFTDLGARGLSQRPIQIAATALT